MGGYSTHAPWNRGGLRSYLLGVALLAGHTTPAWIAAGTPFVLAGIALHLWAKGCLHQSREVTTAGPYRFVRHPFYVANATLDLGIAAMSGWWVLQVALPVWWLAVYLPTIRREEALMGNLFGQAYAEYRQRVPALIPYCRPLPEQPGDFSWDNPNLSRTELPRAFRFLSYPLMFVIAYRLRSAGLGIAYAPGLIDVLTLAACVSLYATGRVLRLHFKHRRWLLPPSLTAAPARLLFLGTVILIGASVRSFEVEIDWAIWLVGLTLVGTSAVAQNIKPQTQLIAEGMMAVGLAVLFELVWLALLLVPVYLAVVLDQQLANNGESPVGEPQPRRFGHAFDVLRGTGAVMAVAKEFWV